MANCNLKSITGKANIHDPMNGLESRVIEKIIKAKALVNMLYDYRESREASKDELWVIYLLEDVLSDAERNAYGFISVKEAANG